MRWIGWMVLAAACAVQGQDWSRLGRLKPGTLIQVHSIGDPYGVDDRCRVESVDPSLLRCVWEGDGVTRMLYPADRVAAVYEVHRSKGGAAGWVALGVGTLGIVGLITGNAGALLIAIVGSIYTLTIATTDIGHAPPERLRVVYRR